MLPLQKNYNITSNEIAGLLNTHYTNLLQAFYESQSSFYVVFIKDIKVLKLQILSSVLLEVYI